MSKKEELVLALIKKVMNDYKYAFNGDDFMGYKFIGEGASFWNDLIYEFYANDESEFLNSYWLKENNVEFVEGWI